MLNDSMYCFCTKFARLILVKIFKIVATIHCVSKKFPMFLAITRESIVEFL